MEVYTHTTTPFDVTVGGQLYYADAPVTGNYFGPLISLEPPKFADNVDKESFKISIADPMLAFSGLADNLNGAKFSYRSGFYNTTGAAVIDSDGVQVEPFGPILSVKDTFVGYQGYLDSFKYQLSSEEGGLLLIEAASPMAALDATNSFYTTAQSIKMRIPASVTDSCFDNIMFDSTEVKIGWGRI